MRRRWMPRAARAGSPRLFVRRTAAEQGVSAGGWCTASCGRARSKACWSKPSRAPREVPAPRCPARSHADGRCCGPVARAALADGDAALDAFAVQLMRPVQPMLADSAEDVDEALAALGEPRSNTSSMARASRSTSRTMRCACSRGRSATSPPRCRRSSRLVRALPARDADPGRRSDRAAARGTPRPFQMTMRRFGRKLDVERCARSCRSRRSSSTVCISTAGRCIDEPLERRVARPRARSRRELARAAHRDGRPRTQARAFRRARPLHTGHEGVMAKALDAPLRGRPPRRDLAQGEQAHTLDLVVLAAEWGHGRRRGWLSNLHLGARDPEHGGFVMLGKTFKGLTDEMLAWQTRSFSLSRSGATPTPCTSARSSSSRSRSTRLQQSPVYLQAGSPCDSRVVIRCREDGRRRAADTIASRTGHGRRSAACTRASAPRSLRADQRVERDGELERRVPQSKHVGLDHVGLSPAIAL